MFLIKQSFTKKSSYIIAPRVGGSLKGMSKNMEIIDKKPVPIYEVKCYECGSTIQYKAVDVHYAHITCPVCGVLLWAMTICPVRFENLDRA